MLPQEALEADGAKIVLAEGLDVLCLVDLALRVHGAACHTIDRLHVSHVDPVISLHGGC